MNLYDTEEIRRSADCLELMRTVFKANERQKGRFDVARGVPGRIRGRWRLKRIGGMIMSPKRAVM